MVAYSDQEIAESIGSVKHWYHQIEIKPGIITPGINNSAEMLRLLDLPQKCKGLRVLDLGTRDGFFAFEMEKRGAEVIAIDYMPKDKTGFQVAAELIQSRVTFVQDNIYHVTREKYGDFDVVLFLGLIYHLPNPMEALSIVRALCRGELYLETYVIDNALLLPDGKKTPLAAVSAMLQDIPLMQFYQGKALNNDFSNFWGPNMKCMEQMLIENNFIPVKSTLNGERGLFKCKVAHDADLQYNLNVARGLELPK